MAINVNSNFLLQSKLFLDSRKSFDTLVDMASFLEGAIPEGFITYCVETDKYYKFNALNDVDATTGKWREFSSGGGDVIDDSLETSTTKTYSIDKIKELMSTQGGVIPVDVLPDLTNEEERKNIKLNKIYLVPNDGEDPNVKDEYVCIHTEGTPETYREPLVTSDVDYDTWKLEVETYVAGGGTLDDDFATFVLVNTTTTMTEAIYGEIVESINASDIDYDSYVARISAIVVTPATDESWKWEKIGSRDGGSVEWGEDIIVNNPSGKVTKGTNLNGKNVLDIVAKMLTVDEPTTISLTLNPSNTDTLFEKNVASIADVGLTAKITLGTGTIADGANIIFKKDGIAISTQPYVDGTYTYTYDEVGANVTDTTKYGVQVEYSMNETTDVAKAEQKYTFVLPIFYGSSATKDVADPTALTKVLSDGKKQTLSYTVVNGYCVLAIPDTLNVTNVLDQNGFDNTADFSYVTQAVTLGTETVVYKVYTNAMAVSCTNFSYQFTLA